MGAKVELQLVHMKCPKSPFQWPGKQRFSSFRYFGHAVSEEIEATVDKQEVAGAVARDCGYGRDLRRACPAILCLPHRQKLTTLLQSVKLLHTHTVCRTTETAAFRRKYLLLIAVAPSCCMATGQSEPHA